MQKMSATEVIVLTWKSNIENTLIARKNIVEIKKFKELIIFRMIFEENKKILKSNDFWVKDVISTTVLRREKFEMIIHEIKVKSMSQDIKKKRTKTIKKVDEIMHLKLQIKSVKWLLKNSEKKKYALIITWVRGAKATNKLIQLKMIIKSDIKTRKYYEKDCRIK